MKTTSKALLIDGLQKLGTALRHSKSLSSQLVLLVTSCSGEELTVLKNLIDLGGDYQNLYKLVYCDAAPPVRDALLLHFTIEGQALVARRREAASALSSPPESPRGDAPRIGNRNASFKNTRRDSHGWAKAMSDDEEEEELHKMKMERLLDGSVGIKILSDIDDTLYSSGGHFPAGCDKGKRTRRFLNK